MSDLQNKVGIVTGGSSGIGFQIANVLAGDGAVDTAVFDDAGLFVGADEAAGGGQGLSLIHI